MTEWLEGQLVRRYKRFLADVRLADGTVITAHCPNTGSMRNCLETDARVWLSVSDNPKRKYAHTFERLQTSRGHLIGINTGTANGLVAEAITAGRIAEIDGAAALRREVAVADSRLDLFSEDKGGTWIEVKSVTLLEQPVSRGVGCFPDAVSERGLKHLHTLRQLRRDGARAVLFFCVQHSGIQEVRPAWHIDPEYSQALAEVAADGVEVIAYKVRFAATGARLQRRLPVVLDPL